MTETQAWGPPGSGDRICEEVSWISPVRSME